MHVRSPFLLAVAVLVTTNSVHAQVAETARPASKTKTVLYDVGDLIVRNGHRILAGNTAAPGQAVSPVSELSRVIIDFNPEIGRKFLGPRAKYRMVLINDRMLEITADPAAHEQIADLLAAVRRLTDVAVVLHYSLFDVDRQQFDRQIAPKLHRQPGTPPVFVEPATEETEQKHLAKGIADPLSDLQPVKTGKITVQNGQPLEFFSWQQAIPHEKQGVPGKAEVAVARSGFSFTATPVVSADRRVVRFTLTQKVSQLVDWDAVKVVRPAGDQKLKQATWAVPIIRDATFTSTFAALDGWPVCVPVQWQAHAEKDRLLVLVFRGQIWIEEEEKALQNQLQQPGR